MNLQDILYYTVAAGINLEKNRTWLTYIPAIGTIKRYQVHCESRGRFFSECFYEIDPAVKEFIRLSE